MPVILEDALRLIQDYRPSKPVSDLLKTSNLETYTEGLRLQSALPQRLSDQWKTVLAGPITTGQQLASALKVWASHANEVGKYFDFEFCALQLCADVSDRLRLDWSCHGRKPNHPDPQCH